MHTLAQFFFVYFDSYVHANQIVATHYYLEYQVNEQC